MEQKYTTVILPNTEIESLKKQIAQLTAERDEFETQLIAAKLKIEKMKCLMDKDQLDKVFSETK